MHEICSNANNTLNKTNTTGKRILMLKYTEKLQTKQKKEFALSSGVLKG